MKNKHPINQYLISVYVEGTKVGEDLREFIKGFNEHYKTDYRIELHELVPTMHEKWSNVGMRLIHSTKKKGNEKD